MRSRLAAILVLLAASTVTCHAADPPLFEYGGKRYGPDELSARMQQLYGNVVVDQYRAMRTLVDEMVFDVHVEQLARASGRDVKEVGRELLQVPEPDEAQIRAFYENNRSAMSQPLDLMHDQIRRALQRQAVLAKREEVIARIKSEGGFKLLLQPPQLPPVAINTRGRPLRGDPSAPITLVEFADYQCPNCQRAVKVLQRLLDQYPKSIKLVYMDFPINASGVSRQVAQGAVCAQAQGRYWDYHDLAFQQQSSLDHDSAVALAKSLQLDMDRFQACMSDPSTRQKVQASENEGRRLGITATPTLFVDGRPFPSNNLLKDLGEYIQNKTGEKPS